MAHEIMIPTAENLPAHIINPEMARQANADAAANISTGFPPRIKMAGKTFAVVDGGGAETAIKNKEMVEGPDENMYLKTVVLRARGPLQKVFYINEYDPNADGGAPDCFSNDGERPDGSIATPQCDVCANCPQNAYGSARKGEGKACADNKILALFLPNRGVHQLKITPASLKNWGMYVKKLSAAGIPVGMVFTLVGFDQEATFPVLTFQYGGPLPEAAVGKLADMAASTEAEDIITSKITAAAAPATTSAKPAEKKPEPKPEPVKEAAPADDLGLGLDEPAKQEAKPAEEPVKEEATAAVEALDADDIAAELGL
jgi:hypothetical protein